MKSKNIQDQLPKYVRLRGLLLEELFNKKYEISDKFYSQNNVVEKFNVSLLTARRALGLLEDEGYIKRENGKGALVTTLPEEPYRLRVSEDCSIGLLICEPHMEDNVAFQKLLMGIVRQACEENYLLQIGRPRSMDDIPKMIEKNHVEGVIIVGMPSKELAKQLQEEKLPVVIMGTGAYNFHYVTSDSKMAGYQAAKYLLELGHRRIGLVSGNSVLPKTGNGILPTLENCIDTISKIDLWATEGINKAFIEMGIDVEANKKFFRIDVHKDEYLLTKELLGEHERPSAILVMSWLGVLGALRAIDELGLKVPQDISVIGDGDNVVAMHTSPLLTAVKLFTEEQGVEAVKLLSMAIKDPAVSPKSVLLPTRLVVRETCAPPAGMGDR